MADIITLPETLTIHTIGQTFSELQERFESAGDAILIDGTSVETLDTSGLQALIVLINAAQENDKQVSWQQTNELIASSAKKLGLNDALLLA
ncbi:STAS domain-containing protein [Thiomicrorhabdus cannonii]|uniref:STAS domain-containing protein n=1 Tax=Thiomicrorhabdus cannonii TaxID=2748011 RepID=UPI0015B8AD12|nr:STAS domain-containing protein [Thiomicrorhabdus cannonii]